MTIFEAIVLGAVQGFSEFLPVSSSGHLVLAQHFLNIPSSGLLFEIALHVATLFAVIVFFRKQILAIDRHMLQMIVIATIPAVVFALLFNDLIEFYFSSILLVLINLFITGLLLLYGHHLSQKTNIKQTASSETSQMTIKNSLTVGIMQSFAILPGISRSGSTVVAGLHTGLSRESAFTFSFLLSIPAILGAVVLKLKDIGEVISFVQASPFTLLAAMISAFIFGLTSLSILKTVILKSKLNWFGYYCLAISSLLMLFVFFNNPY